MTDPGGDRGPGRGFRPPWWPQGEPWPPQGHGPWRGGRGPWQGGEGPGWPGMRRFFLRRLLLLLLALFGVVFGASALAVALFFGASGRGGSVPAALVGATILLALTGLALGGRSEERRVGK